MKILLGVTGSISAYKTYDLVRAWSKANHDVKVILTDSALEFVTPKMFRFLGIKDVYTNADEINGSVSTETSILHIDLARWADRLVVAPCTANTIEKFSTGRANDLLSCAFLAIDQTKPIIIYPAMNSLMLSHPFTKENLQKLETLPQVYIAPTDFGSMACGEIGNGKLLDINEISETAIYVNPFIKTKSVLITTGATVSPIDPVRFVTNSSTGLTGYELALYAHSIGYKVTLLAGKYSHSKINYLKSLKDVEVIKVTTTENMFEEVNKRIQSFDIYISAAAIGDIEFDTNKAKLKKTALAESLPIKKATDILKNVLKNRSQSQVVIGFAAETSLDQDILIDKWTHKPVNLLVGTQVHNGLDNKSKLQGFSNSAAQYKFVEEGKVTYSGKLSKKDLAQEIFSRFN